MNQSTESWINEEVRSCIEEYAKEAIEVFKESGKATDPVLLRNTMNVLSAAISILSVEQGELEIEESTYFGQKRPFATSDKQVRMNWIMTESGARQVRVKYLLKSVSSVVSACKQTMRQLELEARSQV